MTKQALEEASKVAAFAVANAHLEGGPLCDSDLAKQYKGQIAIWQRAGIRNRKK